MWYCWQISDEAKESQKVLVDHLHQGIQGARATLLEEETEEEHHPMPFDSDEEEEEEEGAEGGAEESDAFAEMLEKNFRIEDSARDFLLAEVGDAAAGAISDIDKFIRSLDKGLENLLHQLGKVPGIGWLKRRIDRLLDSYEIKVSSPFLSVILRVSLFPCL